MLAWVEVSRACIWGPDNYAETGRSVESLEHPRQKPVRDVALPANTCCLLSSTLGPCLACVSAH